MPININSYWKNLETLRSYRTRYSIEVDTKLNYPRVEDFEVRHHEIPFARVPLGKKAVWLFTCKEDLTIFKMEYAI